MLTLMNKKVKNIVTIDFPKEIEQINEGDYTIRISAPENSEVEISVNNGDWQPCRSAVGYHWFDWHPAGDTRCKLVARYRIGKGRWKKSDDRQCKVAATKPPINTGLTLD